MNDFTSLEGLRAFFRMSPCSERLVCDFVVGKPRRALGFTDAEVCAEGPAGRARVMKASATMAIVTGRA